MSRVPRFTILAVLLAALSLLVAACGSDDNGTSSSQAAKTTAATEPPLKIAALVDVGGKSPSGQQNTPQVLQAWAKAANAAGGLAGHPVEIQVEDTKGDAPTATAAARRVAGDSSLAAVVMFDHSTEGLIADVITKSGLPVIGGMGYAPNAWGAQPHWYPLTTSIPSTFYMAMVLGKSLGAHKAALTICAEIAGCAAAGPLMQSASDVLGIDFAGTFKILSSAPSFTAECLKIKQQKIDYVALGAAIPSAALRLAADCKTQGYDGKFGLFGGAIVPEDLRKYDPGVPVSLALNAFPWFADAPPAAAYRKLMEQQGVPESVWGDPHSAAAYATLELLKKTVESHAAAFKGVPTREDVIAAYDTIKDETLDGLLAQPITFTPGKPAPLVTCYWFATFDGGTFSDGQLDKPVCDPPELAQPPAKS